jgi:hypothetical protein
MKKYVITASTKTFDNLEDAKEEVERLLFEGDMWEDTVIYEVTQCHYPTLSWRLKKMKAVSSK